MQTQDYWKSFENTGRIQDYLGYVNARRADEEAVYPERDLQKTSPMDLKVGMSDYAGYVFRDGDDSQAKRCW